MKKLLIILFSWLVVISIVYLVYLKKNYNNMVTAVLLAVGLLCFALLFKSIDWFEKI